MLLAPFTSSSIYTSTFVACFKLPHLKHILSCLGCLSFVQSHHHLGSQLSALKNQTLLSKSIRTLIEQYAIWRAVVLPIFPFDVSTSYWSRFSVAPSMDEKWERWDLHWDGSGPSHFFRPLRQSGGSWHCIVHTPFFFCSDSRSDVEGGWGLP